MSPRFGLLSIGVGLVAVLFVAESLAAQDSGFRAVEPAGPTSERPTETPSPQNKATSLAPSGAAEGQRPVTRVSKGTSELPRNHGQVWHEYDISPYTSRVTTTARPEQAIVDWILRETGTEVWFSEPLGLLSATQETLRVYHTPEMQQLIQEVVDRFVSSQAESHAFGLRLITINSPNWRSKALPLMRGVTVQSPGIDAWLLSKENAAVLINDLRKRTDYREHNSPNLLIHNGQSQTITRTQPQNYVRSVRVRENAWPAYDLEMGQIHEGFSLQFSPLLSLDERTVDAVIKCHIDQVEKFIPVPVDVPMVTGQRQTVQIQVPQMVSWRLHERFRWPTESVLLLSCGVVATPSADRPTTLGLPNFLASSPGRADALLFIESNGKASQTLIDRQQTADRGNSNYRGRY